MIIVDTELAKRQSDGNPIRVGLVGAGFMARGIVNQILNYVPGMELVAIANRTAENAVQAYRAAGAEKVSVVERTTALEACVERGEFAVTEDPEHLCAAGNVDILVESTGHVEYGTRVTLAAIANGKHLVSMNAELDATIGPILKVHADKQGVILTGCDGDQPAVQMNLYRFVQSIGLTPLLCGNIKGLQDRYRNPTTQEGFAKQWGQTPHMVTSFADGTKISFEQALVANATGMTVAKRGMLGFESSGHIDDMVGCYDIDELRSKGGIVDYVVGPKPSPGVFVFAAHENDRAQAHYLNYGKLGEGPLYSFYTPYHLTIFEVPLSVARVALFNDVIIAPLAGPVVDVVATAKVDLQAGQTIDGLGGYLTYGLCETAAVTKSDKLLPMGIAEGAVLLRDVPKDQVLQLSDVRLPADSQAVKLRAEQDDYFK